MLPFHPLALPWDARNGTSACWAAYAIRTGHYVLLFACMLMLQAGQALLSFPGSALADVKPAVCAGAISRMANCVLYYCRRALR